MKKLLKLLWGTNHLSGLPRSVEDIERLQLALLPKSRASVHKGEGIYYKGLMYTCERAIQEGWFERHKGIPTRSFVIAHEPIVDRIHLCLNHGRDFEKCVLTAPYRRFKGKDWYEVRDFFALKHIEEKKSVTGTQQSDAEFHADINNLISLETESTERALINANMSKSARLRGTRDSREQIKEFERKHGHVGPSNMPNSSTTDETVMHGVPNEQLVRAPLPDAYVPPAQPIDEIRAARERARHKDG